MGYLEGAAPCDAYTEELDKAVRAAREHREWRRDYMKLEVMRWDMIRKGRTEVLISQVYRKIMKGKALEEIAEDLEEEADKIKPIYDAVMKYFPDDDLDKIFEELKV